MAKLTQAPCVTNGLNLKNLQLFCDTKISTRKSKVSPFASSLSQPCLQNQGPGRVLPFLYLGSQEDALNADTMRDHNITYVLNVTASCPKADFIQESHFMRISVNDSHNEQLIPYFKQAFDFLDNIRQTGGRVIVHCAAGISRSATIVISYIMKHLRMTSEEAYRYVKLKHTCIAPNFNFLGQLLEYEKLLHNEGVLGTPIGDFDRRRSSVLGSPTHHAFAHNFNNLPKFTDSSTKPIEKLSLHENLSQSTPSLSTESAKFNLAPVPFCRHHGLRKTLAEINRKYDNCVEG